MFELPQETVMFVFYGKQTGPKLLKLIKNYAVSTLFVHVNVHANVSFVGVDTHILAMLMSQFSPCFFSTCKDAQFYPIKIKTLNVCTHSGCADSCNTCLSRFTSRFIHILILSLVYCSIALLLSTVLE